MKLPWCRLVLDSSGVGIFVLQSGARGLSPLFVLCEKSRGTVSEV